jgi:hypothetical protein
VRIAKRTNPSSEEGKITNPNIKASLVVLLASTFLATGCGGDEQAQNEGAEEQNTTEQTAGTEAQTRETEAKGDEKVKEGNAGIASSGQEVTLRLEGDPGTEFSGTCRVGGEENDLSGQVPQSFAYNLEDHGIECQIQNQSAGGGRLTVTLLSGNNRSVQQSSTSGGTINLTYSGDGASSSTSSNSVNQVIQSSSS